MGLVLPTSMDQLLYHSNRTIELDGKPGKVRGWVYKVDCPECGKAKMGKPVEKGKVKIRATEYVCPECGHTEEKKEHEDKLTLEAVYTCPFCGKEGEATTEYKLKSWRGVKAYVILCEHCKGKIGVTKKMKEPKK